MKRRFLSLYFIFLFSLSAILIVGFTKNHPMIIVLFSLAAMVASLLVAKSWMKFVHDLTLKSNRILYRQDKSAAVWSFENFEQLEKNHEQLERKFRVSAELISDLAHAEKTTILHELNAEDPIRKALQGIRAEMQKIKEEDDKRAWITQGLARFGEILRNRAEVKEYTYQIISHLVKYINANQGGLYIEYTNEEGERYLQLLGSYAYGKRKHLDQQIREGQGLLGQCMLEKDFVFITDIPKDYVKITSGLGEAVPRNIVIAPLVANEVFCGVIELASFEVMEPHQIEFLKKVCENIASEVAAMKTMDHTKSLLEESTVLAQELQSREQEMKQNLEELAATQAEMTRKQSELSGIINAIDSTLATAELDVTGQLIKHNSILEQFFGDRSDYLMNKNYLLITGGSAEVSWNAILNGKIKAADFKTRTALGQDLWLSVTFTPILNWNGSTERVLCMIQNITQKKIKENEFERLSIVANNTDNSVIITDSNGFIEYVNAGFTKMSGFEPAEVIGKKPGTLLQGPLTDKRTVKKLREHISAGIPIYEEILNYNRKKESYWVSLAINPVKDSTGAITKYISIQSNITETKIRALDFHQKMEALSRSNAIIEISKDGYVLEINDNYLELLGYQREELVGKPYVLLTGKTDVFEKMMDTIDEHGVQNGVFSRYDKKGNRHYMKLIDYPVLNINGDIEKIIEFGVDVSNEKRLEKEAERRQSELKSYLNGIDNTIASAEFSISGHFVDANEIFLKVMGFSKEELTTRYFDFLMGEDQAVIMMWENLRLGKFFSGEFKMKNKAGKELWMVGTFNPITIEGDMPEKIMMFAQFTTQQKEKMNDLNSMVSALKAALPVIEFNADFVCKTANEKAMKMFGVSRLQLRTKTVLDFVAPFYQKMWMENQREVLNSGFMNLAIPFTVEGQIVHYEVSISVNRNLEGEIVKVIFLLVKEVVDKVSLLAVV